MATAQDDERFNYLENTVSVIESDFLKLSSRMLILEQQQESIATEQRAMYGQLKAISDNLKELQLEMGKITYAKTPNSIP